MDVPVIAATRLKGHIENTGLFRGNRRKVALTDEILYFIIMWFRTLFKKVSENNGKFLKFTFL